MTRAALFTDKMGLALAPVTPSFYAVALAEIVLDD